MHHLSYRRRNPAISRLIARLRIVEAARLTLVEALPSLSGSTTIQNVIPFQPRPDSFERCGEVLRAADTLVFMPAEEPPYVTTPSMVALSDAFECGSVEFALGSQTTMFERNPGR